jgi:hypothetical protein
MYNLDEDSGKKDPHNILDQWDMFLLGNKKELGFNRYRFLK